MPFKNWHSARIIEPENFKKNALDNEETFNTKTITRGVQITFGILKHDRSGNTTIQSYRFNKNIFKPIQARKWLSDHNIKYILFENALNKNPDSKKAEKLHREFLGREAASEFQINLKSMKSLTQLGKVHAIEYIARKHNDKRQQLYRHSFKKKPLLLSNGQELIIYGEFKINDRGII